MNKNVKVALQPTQPVDQNPKWLLTEFFVFNPHAHESVCLQSYDSGDSQLDSSELLKFIQHNESVVELQSYADQESNNLLRLVCLQVCMLMKKCGSGRGERAFKYLFFQWYCLCVENLIFGCSTILRQVIEPDLGQSKHYCRPLVGNHIGKNTCTLWKKKEKQLSKWFLQHLHCFCNGPLLLYVTANIYSVFVCFSFPRSLCVDALIELSDENADWKLSFDEFLNCLKPGFNPPEKSELGVILWHNVAHH